MRKCTNKKKISIYVLELENDRYYVGQSKNCKSRIREHFSGKGSAWTKKYRPTKVMQTIELKTCSWRTAFIAEKELTLELMKIYGWENVRGAGWSQIKMINQPQELINSESE